MSADIWANPQKRIELPLSQNLLPVDETALITIGQLQNEDLVEIIYQPNDETDYAVKNPDGSVTRVCETPQINGVMFYIVPGKNKIPRSVYEFLKQRDDDALNKRILPGSVYFGQMS